MPTWSYVDFQIIDGDDDEPDERQAFSEMLKKENEFYECEGGDGSWSATIRSGTGEDFVEYASCEFPGLLFQEQSYSDDMCYFQNCTWKNGKCEKSENFDFCSEVPSEMVQDCVDMMEEWVRDDPHEEKYKLAGLTKLYGLENEQPTTADIPHILNTKYFNELVDETYPTYWGGPHHIYSFHETHKEWFMDDFDCQIRKIFVQNVKKMAKKRLENMFYSVVVLKRFVRSYVEYSNAPGGYAYKKALERFENMTKVEETQSAGKVHKKMNAVADSCKENTINKK
jgi:hypothetical protein